MFFSLYFDMFMEISFKKHEKGVFNVGKGKKKTVNQ